MNDFTKEELCNLMDACMYWFECPDNGIMKEAHELVGKIQSMIDNYCEHESDGHTYYKSGIKCTDFLTYACSESPCLLKCKKCSELFDEGRP